MDMIYNDNQVTPEVVKFQDALERYRRAKQADNGTYPAKLRLDALAVDVANAALEAGL